jgi:hypothetical protein
VFSFFKRKLPSSRGLFIPEEFAATRVWANSRDYLGALPTSPDNVTAYVYARLLPVLHHCNIGKITIKQNDRPF